MKLKETIPIYKVGQQVTIIEIDLSIDYIVNVSLTMSKQLNKIFTIREIINQEVYLLEEDSTLYSWSYDLFKESYDYKKQKIEIGTYLLNANYSDLLFEVNCITDSLIHCFYKDIRIKKSEFIDPNLTTYNFGYVLNENNEFQFINTSMYYPTNEQLEKFGVSNNKNIEIVKTDNILLDLFKNIKYPIEYLIFSSKKNNKSDYEKHEEVIFKITNDIFVGYKNNKYITYKNCFRVKTLVIDDKIIKNIVKKWGKVTINNYVHSSNLFGHVTRKQKMNDLVNNKKQIFTINNIIIDYEKNGNKYNVIEVFDGILNLKFLMEDVNLILPKVTNYIIPKDRTIKKFTECKIINNKLLPVVKNTKVKVIKLFNRHTPINNKTFDKNTIALVSVFGTSKFKQFECKIKQLKSI